ncbi:hypothetical protein H0H81_003156, partial [Sphagnurus paluster]
RSADECPSHPRSEEDEIKSKNVWLKGHTELADCNRFRLHHNSLVPTCGWPPDPTPRREVEMGSTHRECFGTCTPVSISQSSHGFQVVNAGDALEFLCGGFYPATRHRVVQPPADQQKIPRLGVFYFVMPDDEKKLVPYDESPVLQKVGITRRCDPKNIPNMEEWRKARTASYGKVQLRAGDEQGVEEEVVNGVVVKHYN